MLEPPAVALPLRLAFERFAEAHGFSVTPGVEPPTRLWRPLMCSRDDAVQAFGLALRDGQLEAWARKGDPLGMWAEIPTTAWPHLEVLSWSAGVVGLVRLRQVPVTVGVGAGRSQVTWRNIREYDEYFDVRIAPAERLSEPAPPKDRKRRPPTLEELRAWYAAERLPKPTGRDEDHDAARVHFGRWPKDRDDVRNVRGEYPEKTASGPRRKPGGN